MSNYLENAFDRLDAMVKEAVATKRGDVDIYFWPYEQEGPFPYFTKRLGAMTNDTADLSEDFEIYNHTILLRMVVGHFKDGYTDGIQDETHIYVQLLETYLREHPYLQTDAGSYTAAADWLQNLQPLLAGHTGLVVFSNAGIFGNQIGCEYTLRLRYIRNVN